MLQRLDEIDSENDELRTEINELEETKEKLETQLESVKDEKRKMTEKQRENEVSRSWRSENRHRNICEKYIRKPIAFVCMEVLKNTANVMTSIRSHLLCDRC